MEEIREREYIGWGICPACGKERRTKKDKMLPHNRWHERAGEMVPCEGSGYSISRATRAPGRAVRGRHVIRVGASSTGA